MMAEKDAERGSVQKGTAPNSEHHCSRVRTFSASYVVYLLMQGNCRSQLEIYKKTGVSPTRLFTIVFLRLTSQPR